MLLETDLSSFRVLCGRLAADYVKADMIMGGDDSRAPSFRTGLISDCV
jgi:hypothetical protein